MYQKGKESERAAARHLKKEGYIIHFKNKRVGRLEVDLVCEKSGVIIFIE